MDVYLNNEPFTRPPQAATINDVLAAIGDDDPDRLIIAFRLDGEDVDEDSLPQILAAPVTQPGRLDIEVDSARSLAAQTLGQAANALEQTREHYVRIAELIACDKVDPALALLNECFAIWNTAEQSLRQSAQAAGIDLDAPATADSAPSAMVDRLGEVLRQIQTDLGARDLVAVADLLEYDLADVTDGWQCMLVALQQQVQKA